MRDGDAVLVESLEPDPAKVRYINDRLFEDLEAKGVAPENRSKLCFTLERPDGEVVGGIVGDIRWNWLKIESLWVHAALQNQGAGGRLLARAEQHARALGARFARTSTYSVQALPFYLQHGYAVQAAVPEYPPGEKKYYLSKLLDVDGPASDLSWGG